ncbi:MAG: hypothetical protein AAF196_18710 [Planctomycetota bacterium]
MTKREFRPGFRLSWMDGLVLVVGGAGSALVWGRSPYLAILLGTVVLHFFLFCNVFRVARIPELVWSGILIACVLAEVSLGLPRVAAVSVILTGTVAVVWQEMRKPAYHGVWWTRTNPGLRSWWEDHQSANSQRPSVDRGHPPRS